MKEMITIGQLRKFVATLLVTDSYPRAPYPAIVPYPTTRIPNLTL